MDITSIFKECLEILRQKNKELAFINPPDKKSSAPSAKSKIFPGKKSEYYSKARELSSTITSLHEHLKENRNDYLNITSLGHNSVFNSNKSKTLPIMSDIDREMLDNDVQKIIHKCQHRIQDYENIIHTTESIQNNEYLRIHMESIAESLKLYLKGVTTVFSEIRAVRVKRTVDYQNMSKLSSVGHFQKKDPMKRDNGFSSSHKRKSLTAAETEEMDNCSPTIPEYFLDAGDIPPEELQLLEAENAALLSNLNSLSQEVDQIQSNVIQIAELQEIFTEKVLQQEKDVETIGSVVVGATENIKGGNEQIRQAIQNNADFRVWVLFFILVMSFSLLFLDWYNE